jgi:hypothetical protein
MILGLLVGDNNVRHLEMLNYGMQISKMDTTAREVVRQFLFTIEHADGVVNGSTIALY